MGRIIAPHGMPGLYGHDAKFKIDNRLLSHYPFTFVGDRDASSDRVYWPITALGVPRFDYMDGDGNSYLRDGVPEAFATIVGAGTSNPTLWTNPVGGSLTSHYFGPASVGKRTTSAGLIDPVAGQDIVILAFVCLPTPLASYCLIGTRQTTTGWSLKYANTSYVQYMYNDGVNPTLASQQYFAYPGWHVLGVTVRYGVDQSLYFDGALADSDSLVGYGPAIPGAGIGLTNPPAGGSYGPFHIGRVVFWYGAGLGTTANAAWHARVARHLLGRQELVRDAIGTFTRYGTASCIRPGSFNIIGTGVPRVTSIGVFCEPYKVNKVYNTWNPQNTTGWTSSGGTFGVVDDSTALIAAGLTEGCINSFRHDSTVGNRRIYNSCPTGNNYAHSGSIYMRGAVGGESISLGYWDISAGAMTVVSTHTLTTGYVRYSFSNVAPGDTDRTFCLLNPAGQVIYFALPQLEEGQMTTSPIPNVSTVASAQRNADVFDTAEDPDDLRGHIDLTVTPSGWSGATWGTVALLYLSGSGNPSVWIEGGTYRARIDGTTDLDSGVSPSDGVEHTIKLRWGGAGQSIEVWAGSTLLGSANSAYDGTLYSAGVWEIAPQAPIYIKDLKTWLR